MCLASSCSDLISISTNFGQAWFDHHKVYVAPFLCFALRPFQSKCKTLFLIVFRDTGVSKWRYTFVTSCRRCCDENVCELLQATLSNLRSVPGWNPRFSFPMFWGRPRLRLGHNTKFSSKCSNGCHWIVSGIQKMLALSVAHFCTRLTWKCCTLWYCAYKTRLCSWATMRVRQNRVLANCVAHFHARRWSGTLIAVEPFRVHFLLWFHVFTESAIAAFSIDLSTLYTRHFHTPHSTLHTWNSTPYTPHFPRRVATFVPFFSKGFDICTVNIRGSMRVSGLHFFFRGGAGWLWFVAGCEQNYRPTFVFWGGRWHVTYAWWRAVNPAKAKKHMGRRMLAVFDCQTRRLFPHLPFATTTLPWNAGWVGWAHKNYKG